MGLFPLVSVLIVAAGIFSFVNYRFIRLPQSPNRNLVLAVTYIVVIFSILVQGLTIGNLIRRLCPASGSAAEHV